MRISRTILTSLTVLAVCALLGPAGCTVAPAPEAGDPLPSWNDGPAKASILEFVAAVTDPANPSYVPPAERIAVTDNDGTLWSESPMPVQAAFVFQRIAELAPEHPEWQTTQPFQAVLEQDAAALASLGHEEIEQLVAATHAGMTVEEFDATVRAFLATARDPRFGLPYTRMVYQPMLELLDLLRANAFDVFIVSGGGVDFMRAFAQEVYGIPPQNVIGSSLQYEFQQTDDGAVLVRLPELVSFDDREQKPVNIQLHIGRRPVVALGNSDGDLAMFQYTAGGGRPYLNVLVVHDDPEREYESLTGTDEVMAAMAQSPWTFASMRNDWKTIFPVQPGAAETEAAAPAGVWQTFTNPAGFSLQAPADWIEQTLPDQGDGAVQGTSYSGPEGGVEVYWGAAFGGACPSGTSPLQLAGEEVLACHTTAADGTQMWTQIDHTGAGGEFYSARAWTNDAEQASADLVLAVLATLAFTPPEAVDAAPEGAGWHTYTNAEAGFSVTIPDMWEEETLPDQNDGALHGMAFSGPGGGVEVYWGAGFGGACPQGTVPVWLAGEERQACYAALEDGTERWEQMGYEVEGGNFFSVCAYTSDSRPASRDLVLQVLATLAFMPPAEPAAGSEGAALANPASQNCTAQGGTLAIVERGDGGEYGICLFEDNRQCEEWALLRGECPVGGVKVTGYATDAAIYCAMTGGTYAVTGSAGAEDEQGTCTLPGGALCDAWEYYNGVCAQ